MKQLKIYLFAFAGMVLAVACNNEKETASNKTIEIAKVETVKSDYSIPELVPVTANKDGYSAEESHNYRGTYNASSAVIANDEGSYFSSRYSDFMPTAVVHRGGDVSHLKANPVPEVGQVGATTLLGTMTLEEMMADPRSRMKGIAVIHDGELVYENYLGMREWDNHIWASGTKIFSGSLMAIAENEGLVDISKSVSYYLTELKGTDWDKVSVGAAVHMRSGMDISESRLGIPNHPVTRLYQIASGDKSLPEGSSMMDAVKDSKLYVEPDTNFEYASINTFVAGLVLERVYNKTFEDLITEKIWLKSGMEGDGTLGLSASGEPLSFGAFSSRLRDFARYGMLYTPSWKEVSSEQVIPDNYFTKVKDAAKPEMYGDDYMSQRLINDFGEDNFGAAYQWDAVFSDGDMYKSGRTGQCLYVSPETNTVVVWFSSAYKAEYWAHAYAREIVKQLFRD